MYSLIIKDRALRMTLEAYDWYEVQKKGLGEEFLAELDTSYKKIQTHPTFYSIIKKNYRQVSLKRFPYVIVYEIIKSQVIVFAVFHTSRNPGLKFRD